MYQMKDNVYENLKFKLISEIASEKVEKSKFGNSFFWRGVKKHVSLVFKGLKFEEKK